MKRLAVVLALVVAAACTEQATAPGLCPNFCPGGEIDVRDTVLTDAVERDSAFRGYVQPHNAAFAAVAAVPGVIDSRAIFKTNAMDTLVVVRVCLLYTSPSPRDA